jgi:hypothetical protein
MWMPWDEALTRAGSLDALRPHLCAGSILARRAGLYSLPGARAQGGPGNISSQWWAKAHEDAATGRVMFTFPDRPSGFRELFAIGIEVERAAVERLFPVAPKLQGRKRGTKPSKVWQDIFDHFDAVVAREGKFLSVGSAASSVEAWLKDKNKSLSRSAIERGIPKYRPDWITA